MLSGSYTIGLCHNSPFMFARYTPLPWAYLMCSKVSRYYLRLWRVQQNIVRQMSNEKRNETKSRSLESMLHDTRNIHNNNTVRYPTRKKA